MRRHLLSIFSVLTLAMGLLFAPAAPAATTAISFNSLAPNTPATTQFQSLGVTISGAYVYSTASTVWTNPYGENILEAPSGLMTFTLNPTIIGSVQSVSAYLSTGTTTASISAYDASSNLVGQVAVPANANSQLFSVTSSGSPISAVQISGSGSAYAVEEIAFNSSVAFAKYSASVYIATRLSAFAASETFTLGANSTGITPPSQAVSLTIGALTINLPAGSFVQDQPPRKGYVYRGKVNGVNLFVDIYPTNAAQSYGLFVLGDDYAFLGGLSSMPVAVSIGNNSGSTTVTPHYVSLPPTSP